MGAKESKSSCINYEEAIKRVSDSELRRIKEAFKKSSGPNGTYLSESAFQQDVLCESVPTIVAEWLYTACGGTSKGITFKDLFCGLVLLTRGTEDEKIRFLWNLYSNDSGSYILKSDYTKALKLETNLYPNDENRSLINTSLVLSLFSLSDRVDFKQFRDWIIKHKKSTILSKWLLIDGCMQLPTELETPTFYQSLAGVTHLEEQDIGDLEKEFWNLKNSSITGQLDLETLGPLISPPIPKTALIGLFNAFDENRDGHIDFKELCCGVSAACRGPNVERSKFCFKVFDIDRDGVLNYNEVKSMIDVLLFVAKESRNANNYRNIDRNQVINDLLKFTRNDINSSIEIDIPLEQNSDKNDVEFILTQEDFMMWNVDSSLNLVQPFLDLYFEVCHIVFGLRPQCKHLEFEIVRGWLSREERRGYMIGQFWYLISKDWWNSWCQYTQNYSSIPCAYCKNSLNNLSANRQISGVDEAMVCDESFTSNSSESMGDLLATTDSSSLGSGSSGISCGNHQQNSRPGPIDNTNLITPNTFKNVRVLTGEGGHLKKDTPLVQRHDFELIPKSLWKALARWYGDTLPLPRQVIQPPNSPDVELELYPLNLQILLHQNVTPSSHSLSSWSAVSGGYSAITPGGGYTAISAIPNALHPPKRYLAYTAAFSRLATIKLVAEFLCEQLKLKPENIRLWHVISSNLSSCEDISILLEEDNATLQELNIRDRDKILLEIRNKDLTWPEELGSLSLNQGTNLDRRPTSASVQSLHAPGATGLHNLGNTCFMNAALQVLFNTQPLTQYFRRNMHLYELNMTNKLGTKGQLATRYGELLKEIWTATTRSVAPLKLRFCVTKHAPQFAGGGQHDCQELLEWLLDALHEDLNRVTEKPYTELKDSDGRPDEIVAAEAWALHHSRNQSIVIDLFYGQLKSKVSCLCCGRESVRFDPFSLLSLPLPVENFIYFEILVILLDGSLPIKYGCKINSDSKYIDLKRKLASLCHLNPYLMLFCELNNSQIKCILPDGQKIKLQTATELYCYQLPEDGDETRSRTSSILGVNIEKGLKDIQRNPALLIASESSTMQQTQLQPQQQHLSVSSSSSSSTSVLQQSSQQQQQQTTNSNNNINNNNYCNNNNNSKNISFYNPKMNYDNVMIRHNNDNNSIIVDGMIGGDDNSMIVECRRPTITTTTAITTTTSSSKVSRCFGNTMCMPQTLLCFKQSSEISTSPENTFVNPNRKRISTMNLLNDNNTQSSNNSSDEHDSNIEKLSSYIGGGGVGVGGGGNGIDVINDGNGIGIGGINRCIDEINYDNYYDENCGDDVINIYDNDNDYGNGSSIITTDEEEINRLDCPCRTKNNLMNNKKIFNYNDDNTEKLNHIDYDLINNHHSSSLPQQIITQKNFENFQRINTATTTTTTKTETTNNFNINHNININNNNNNMNSINNNNNYNNNNSASMIPGRFLIAVHRKLTRQDTYFLSHHKTRSNLFGVPLLIPCYENGTNKDVYCAVWMQVSRLLSPLPPTADQANHAADCDDSLGYDFPFTLRAVTNDGRMCALCPWSNFCRGCEIPCNDDLLLQSRLISSSSNNSSNSSTPTLSHRFSSSLPNLETSKQNSIFFSSNRNLSAINIAIDWDPTALHLRYQSTREKLWTEHESLAICRRQQIEPVDLNHCLRSFTSEEKLEQWYHCSHCKSKKPATKKLQIWRLPPILIIHLKRFNFVNDKWVKSQKVVNFPFEDFDPTPYLASVPQETILRHKELLELKANNNKNITCNNEMLNHIVGVGDGNIENLCLNDKKMMMMMKNHESEYHHNYFNNKPTTTMITTTTIETTEECEKIDNDDDTKDKINSNELINYQKVVSAVTENNYDNNQKNHFDNKEQYEKLITSTSSTATATATTTTTMINTTTIPSTSNTTVTTSTIQQTSSASCDAMNTTTTTRKLSNAKLEKRKRLISTSLTRTPVIDGHFKDFHHHRLKDGVDHLDLKYNLYAVVSHSGMLNGGHYISYAANPNGSWYCYNDSSCREIPNRPNIDPSSAYLLFYERNGLNYEPYLPNIDGRTLPNGGNASIELDDSDNDLKKMCTIS